LLWLVWFNFNLIFIFDFCYVFLIRLRECYIIKISYTKIIICSDVWERFTQHRTHSRESKKYSSRSPVIPFFCSEYRKRKWIKRAHDIFHARHISTIALFAICPYIIFCVVTTLFKYNKLKVSPTLCYPHRRILWLPWRYASSSVVRLFYQNLQSWRFSGFSRWLRHRCCTPTKGQWNWLCPENRISTANKLPVRPTRNRISTIARESVFLVNSWNIVKSTMFQAHISTHIYILIYRCWW